MYETLIDKIQTTLDGVAHIKRVYNYPVGEDEAIDAFPAAIFYPDVVDNSFETTQDNAKDYRFKVWIVINCDNDSVENVFSSALPSTVDAVIDAFDSGWNYGTVDGHRITALAESGIWSQAQAKSGLEATAELTLRIRTLTSV